MHQRIPTKTPTRVLTGNFSVLTKMYTKVSSVNFHMSYFHMFCFLAIKNEIHACKTRYETASMSSHALSWNTSKRRYTPEKRDWHEFRQSVLPPPLNKTFTWLSRGVCVCFSPPLLEWPSKKHKSMAKASFSVYLLGKMLLKTGGKVHFSTQKSTTYFGHPFCSFPFPFLPSKWLKYAVFGFQKAKRVGRKRDLHQMNSSLSLSQKSSDSRGIPWLQSLGHLQNRKPRKN